MNPHFYTMLPFLAFGSFLIILGLWTTHGIRKETAAKRRAGFATAEPDAHLRSSE
jgi:hypothetical protein